MICKAVILIAGLGSRLQPLTLTHHKCMTEVNGIPILRNALSILEDEGIDEAILVVGYLADQIRETMGSCYGSMKITYVENIDYRTTNTSYSLLLGIDNADSYDALLVIEGDVFFEQSILHALMLETYPEVTVLERYNSILDGSFVTLGDDGFVKDWRHKSLRPEGYTIEDKFKTVNIHKFTRKFVDNKLRPHLVVERKNNNGTKPLEHAMLQIVSNNPKLIRGMVLSGQRWCEIDDQQDLNLAETIFYGEQNDYTDNY